MIALLQGKKCAFQSTESLDSYSTLVTLTENIVALAGKTAGGLFQTGNGGWRRQCIYTLEPGRVEQALAAINIGQATEQEILPNS